MNGWNAEGFFRWIKGKKIAFIGVGVTNTDCIRLFAQKGAAVSVLEGAYAGTGFGLVVGLLWELAYPGGFGGLVFYMALAGMAMGAVSQYALSQSFLGCLICAAGTLGLLDLLRVAGRLLARSAGLSDLLEAAIPEFLWSLAWTPLVWLIFCAVHRRVGGNKLA